MPSQPVLVVRGLLTRTFGLTWRVGSGSSRTVGRAGSGLSRSRWAAGVGTGSGAVRRMLGELKDLRPPSLSCTGYANPPAPTTSGNPPPAPPENPSHPSRTRLLVAGSSSSAASAVDWEVEARTSWGGGMSDGMLGIVRARRERLRMRPWRK